MNGNLIVKVKSSRRLQNFRNVLSANKRACYCFALKMETGSSSERSLNIDHTK
jgi:hypothetical protein